MSRRWLIILSLLAHLGIAVGLFVTGVWRLERLEGRANFALGVMAPFGGDEGGHAKGDDAKNEDAPKKEKEKKDPPKRVVKEPHQPAEVKPAVAVVASTITGDVDGNGTGSGAGSGSSTGLPTIGGVTCDTTLGPCTGGIGLAAPVCGDHQVEGGEACDDGNTTSGDGCSAACKIEQKVTLLPPKIFSALRIAGDTLITPPDPVKTQMLREGRASTSGTLKLCIGTDGTISSTSILGSTKYPAYDAKLVAGVRLWRYKPYLVNNTPMPACSAVTFVYTIE